MKKRLSILIVAVLTLTMLSGCGKKEVTENVALLTLAAENDYTANEVKATTERYATENGLLYKQHLVKSSSTEDIDAEIQAAAAAGADVVVCSGTAFEVPLYEVQGQYKDMKFIIIDGAPRKEEGKKYKVRKNTKAILYAEEQGGFLAGYAAVKEGYKNLGFMGGVPTDSVIKYGTGFAQGANYAAEELGLPKEAITVRYMYVGTNEMSPALMEMAGQWYDDGCEVIFASGGTIGTAVMKAAENKGKKVIGVDRDQASESNSVIVSVVKQIDSTLYAALTSVYDDEFKGKKAEIMNVAEGGIGLSIDKAQFTIFTQQDYSNIIEKMSGKDLKISTDDVVKLQEKGNHFGNIVLNLEQIFGKNWLLNMKYCFNFTLAFFNMVWQNCKGNEK